MFSRLFCALLLLCAALNGGRAGLLISVSAKERERSGFGCSAGTTGTDVAGVVVAVGEDFDGCLG